MTKKCKKNCTFRQLSLKHDEPIAFVVSQWQSQKEPSVTYLTYRWIVALFFFTTWIIALLDLRNYYSECKAKWFIYFTNWGYTACAFESLIDAIILSVCVLVPKLQNSALKFYKFYWMLYIIATDSAFVITTLFWSLLYEKTMVLNEMSIFVHAFNFILMMIDLFVVAHPIRILHCCYPSGFVMCYSVFSVIFYASGGTNEEGQVYIYKNLLDWRKPESSTLSCLAALLYIIIVHTICWGLYKFRVWIHFKCVSESGADSSGFRTEERVPKRIQEIAKS